MRYAQLFIGAGLTLLGIWIGMAFATATDAGAQAKWWDLMTAFGTVGATAAAIFIALWGQHLRSREARARAVLSAARMEPRFELLRTRVAWVRESLNGIWADINPGGPEQFRNFMLQLQAGYELGDLEPLVALRNDASIAGLRALRALERIKLSVELPSDPLDSEEDRRELYRSWTNILYDAEDSLRAAVEACRASLPDQFLVRVMY